MQDTENLQNANFKIDRDLWQRFKEVAKKNNCDASKVLRSFIIKYLKDNENLSKF